MGPKHMVRYSLLRPHAVLQPLKEQIYLKHIFCICLHCHVIDSCSNAVWRQQNERHCVEIHLQKKESNLFIERTEDTLTLYSLIVQAE